MPIWNVLADTPAAGSQIAHSAAPSPKPVDGRPAVDPFFAYDANYLIDNKVGIIIDAEGTRADRTVEIAVTQTMVDRVRRRFDLQPQRLAGDTVYGAVRLLKWLVDRKITPHVPVWDKSARTDGTFSRSRLCLRPRAQCLYLPRWRRADQHRQHRSGPHRLLQGYQERLLDVLAEAHVHDGGGAQDYPRP